MATTSRITLAACGFLFSTSLASALYAQSSNIGVLNVIKTLNFASRQATLKLSGIETAVGVWQTSRMSGISLPDIKSHAVSMGFNVTFTDNTNSLDITFTPNGGRALLPVSDMPEFWTEFTQLAKGLAALKASDFSQLSNMPAVSLVDANGNGLTDTARLALHRFLVCVAGGAKSEVLVPGLVDGYINGTFCSGNELSTLPQYHLALTAESWVSLQPATAYDSRYLRLDTFIESYCPIVTALGSNAALQVMTGLRSAGWITADDTVYSAQATCTKTFYQRFWPGVETRIAQMAVQPPSTTNSEALAFAEHLVSGDASEIWASETAFQNAVNELVGLVTNPVVATSRPFSSAFVSNSKISDYLRTTSSPIPAEIAKSGLRGTVRYSQEVLTSPYQTEILEHLGLLFTKRCNNGAYDSTCISDSLAHIQTYAITDPTGSLMYDVALSP